MPEQLSQIDGDFEHPVESSSDRLARITRDIHRRLTLGQGSDQVLDALFMSLQTLIPYDRMSVALVEDEGRLLRLRWVRSRIESKNVPRNYAASLSQSLEEIFTTGRPRIIQDLADYLRCHPNSASTALILKDGIQSSLTCPLIANSSRVGVVFFSSTRLNTYNEHATGLFLEIADLISLVVEQSRLRIFYEQNIARVRTLGTVLHDLRNPLSVIQGIIQLSEDEDWFQTLPDQAKESFSMLERSSRFMLDLLGDLSLLTVNPEADLTLQAQEFNMSDVIKEWIESGKVLARRKDILFETRVLGELPPKMRFDRNRIRQVVENLISNAVKFSFPKSKILVEIQGEAKRLLVRVIDQHHGMIGVTSQVKQGSTFWFSIPYGEAPT